MHCTASRDYHGTLGNLGAWRQHQAGRKAHPNGRGREQMAVAAAARDSQLANPLVSIDQLAASASQFDGLPPELERSIIAGGAQRTQSAGVLLRLPQHVIARAIVTFSRFWVGPEGGSLREFGALVSRRRCGLRGKPG
jgi:hypothetical protein